MTSPITREEFFASVRHLPAREAARAIDWVSGVDFTGCSKDLLFRSLSERHGGLSPERLRRFRATRARTGPHAGAYGVTEADRLHLVIERDLAQGVFDKVTGEYETMRTAGRTDVYGHLNVHIPRAKQWLNRVSGAIQWLDERQADPRAAALARLRSALAGNPDRLADLDLVVGESK